MSESINFNIRQGDTLELRVIYTNSDGSPINLTGYGANFVVKDQPGGKITCASAILDDGITFTEAEGLIVVTIYETDKFTYPKAAYQLQIVEPGGKKETILSGWFAVEKGI